MNLVERLKKDKKGFTLIEMIVVIVILLVVCVHRLIGTGLALFL